MKGHLAVIRINPTPTSTVTAILDTLEPLPTEFAELAAFFQNIFATRPQNTPVALENVRMRAGDRPNIGKLVESRAHIEATLQAYRCYRDLSPGAYPTELVLPTAWQAAHTLTRVPKPQRKYYHQQKALQLYPPTNHDFRITQSNADAILLADFIRQKYERFPTCHQ